MSKFKYLEQLNQANIFYIFIPFTQIATVESLAGDWKGKCGAIAHDWLMRKLTQDILHTQTTYSITQPNLPHPIVMGDNNSAGEDITKTHSFLNSIYAKKDCMESSIEHPHGATKPLSMSEKVDSLINYIGSQPHHHGVINTLFYVKPDDNAFGHSVSFVKRDDHISFFDPNHGEITFNSFNDFRFWFKKEAIEGDLKFLIADDNVKRLLDLFAPETFTSKEANVNKLSKNLNAINVKKATDRKEVMVQVGNYNIISYSSENFINPNNFKIIQALQSHIASKGGVRGVKDLFDSSLKIAKQYLKILTTCSKNQPLFDAMMVVFANNYPGNDLKKKIAYALGYTNYYQLNSEYAEKIVRQFPQEKLKEVISNIIKPAEKCIRAGRMPDMTMLANSVSEHLDDKTPSLRFPGTK